MTQEEIKNKISLYGLTKDLHNAVCALLRRSVSRNSIHLALNTEDQTPLRQFIRETAKEMVSQYEASLPQPLPNPGMRVMESI